MGEARWVAGALRLDRTIAPPPDLATATTVGDAVKMHAMSKCKLINQGSRVYTLRILICRQYMEFWREGRMDEHFKDVMVYSAMMHVSIGRTM